MSDNYKSKTLLTIFVLALVLAGVYFYYDANLRQEQNVNSANLPLAQEAAKQTTVTYHGVEGKTALELLKENYPIQTTNYEGLGEFVTSINGVSASPSFFWAFYVNGQMSQVGASEYVTKDGDVIEWRLEEIN